MTTAQPKNKVKRIKLSYSQRKVLLNLVNGKAASYRLSGRSELGGFQWTISSLTRNGLIDHNMTITDAGKTALGAQCTIESQDKLG